MSDEKVQIYLCEQDSTAMFFPNTWGKLDKWACFDLDWTLAFPMKSLYHHPADDIHLLPGRKEKLLSLYFDHHLVIFTNQLAKRKERPNIIARIRNFLLQIELPIFIFISFEQDSFRKPERGLFDLASKVISPPKELFYVGDAVGRPQDFSNSDRLFAEKIQAKLYTPEEFFPPVFPEMKFQNKSLINSESPEGRLTGPEGRLILLGGPPGSGKSTFARKYLSDWTILESDVVGKKLKPLAEQHLKTGQNLVIDATNANRDDFNRMAQQYGYTVYNFYFARNGYAFNQLRDKPVPKIAYFVYYKKFVPFTEKEKVSYIWY